MDDFVFQRSLSSRNPSKEIFEAGLMNWLRVRVVNRHLKKVSMLECQLCWGDVGLLWVRFNIWSSSTWSTELEYV